MFCSIFITVEATKWDQTDPNTTDTNTTDTNKRNEFQHKLGMEV
jgi:hypothetical protein